MRNGDSNKWRTAAVCSEIIDDNTSVYLLDKDSKCRSKSLVSMDDECSTPAINSSIMANDSCGIIESVHLVNFMCHSNLKFDFGPRLNFITGQNGSGKSAVLSGLVLGLGGKAISMNRGSSVGAYIKTDCSQAEVIVTLANKGEDSFEPEKFGDKIIVKRKILSAGGGSYKLCDSRGKLVSQKRDDLSRMLQHFNIQLNNPVTILTQDVSRQFLQSMKPANLYKLFMQGTQLDQLTEDLLLIANNQQAAEQTIKSRSQVNTNAARTLDDFAAQSSSTSVTAPAHLSTPSDSSYLRDLKGLSGGERSFVTVCFLLAMWRLMDVPFRFLDEFDVFMDPENRQITTSMIVEFAQKSHLNGQMMLSSPINLELIGRSTDIVKIFQLEPPRSGMIDSEMQELNGNAHKLEELASKMKRKRRKRSREEH